MGTAKSLCIMKPGGGVRTQGNRLTTPAQASHEGRGTGNINYAYILSLRKKGPGILHGLKKEFLLPGRGELGRSPKSTERRRGEILVLGPEVLLKTNRPRGKSGMRRRRKETITKSGLSRNSRLEKI